MKWIKYRRKFASGPNDWIYEPIENIENWDEEGIEEFIESLHDEYSWSDKYRGVDFDIVESSEVPKIKISKTIKSYKDRIDYYKRETKNLKNMVKLLNEEIDKGSDIDPDEEERKERQRKFEEFKKTME